MRVLLIEGNAKAARSLGITLKAAGAVVDHSATGAEALELSRHYQYDVVLLELALPDIDGFDVVRRMRTGRNDTPVLILTGLDRPEVKVRSLGLGADGYMTKPFDTAELLARMQAVVRRSKGYSQPSLRIGPIELNMRCREARVEDRPMRLSGREYSILELLVLRKGVALSKDFFLDHLCGGLDEPEAKVIDVYICRLRRKLAEAGADNMIGTVRGRGYIIREPSHDPSPDELNPRGRSRLTAASFNAR
jgi:two-component system cell cycle response regulator CtrA